MKFYLGVTDNKWYRFLREKGPEEVNFWQPGEQSVFKVLQPGDIFLFKLKSPLNAIGGLGFFSHHTRLPLKMAWEVFGEQNGCEYEDDFRRMILDYRQDKYNYNPSIGCVVLTNPLFFNDDDFIPVPENWSKSIVQGKGYTTGEPNADFLWMHIQERLQKYLQPKADNKATQLEVENNSVDPAYRQVLTNVRLGQNSFRLKLTDAYSRKCSITGEKTLPVLEAAHIKPYAKSGPHLLSNGLILRADLHKLFDNGYITITSDYKIEVSNRIKEEFQNGKEYYQFHGKQLINLPLDIKNRPDAKYIEWHNNTFK